MRKALIVSPEEYFDFFKDSYPEWDIQRPVTTIEEMWDGLNDGTLDDDAEIVVLNDFYYDQNGEALEQAIASLAPAALVLVIADEEYADAISDKVAYVTQRDYLDPAKYWFISRQNPIVEINDALDEYFNSERYLSQHANVDDFEPEVEHGHPTTSDSLPAASQSDVYYSDDSSTDPYSNNPYKDYSGNEVSTDTAETNQYQDRIDDLHEYVENFKNASFEGDGYTGPERNGMVIASTSSKGGSGKSTVALSTASMFYHASRLAFESGKSPRPLDVVVVDMDTRDGQIGFMISQSSPTILNVFTSQDFSRNNIRNNLVYNNRLGFHAMLAPKRAVNADYTTPEFYRDIIMKLRTMFDIVILDTSVNYSDPLIYDVVLPISDAVLFVTDMSRGSVFGMTRWVAEVTLPLDRGGQAAISKDKIGVVINKAMANVGFDQSNLVEAAAEVPLIASIPMDSKSVLLATNTDRLDEVVLKHPTISPAYFSLVQKIVQDSVPILSPLDESEAGQSDSSKKAALPPKKKLFGGKRR